MKVITKTVFFLLIYGAACPAAAKELTEKVLVYRGTSDASAAVAIGENTFIVADDENNILRVYRTDMPGLPVFSYELTNFLDIEPGYPEADIEGATRVADRIYWITSHGRNKDGTIRPNRYRFFATTVKVQEGNITIRPVGICCKSLVHNLIKTKTMRHLGLDKVTRFDGINPTKKEREKLAPKEQGLNIEALCASADGKMLYIGFRNPRPRDRQDGIVKALVVPLKNPDAVIEGSAMPIFGEPILWDVGSLGIRSMEYSHFHRAYFIVAGPHSESSGCVLYRWSGKDDEPLELVQRSLAGVENNFTPEALVPFKGLDKLLMLSDDGSLDIKVSDASECMEGKLNDDGTCPNKFLTDANKKTFRAIWLTP